MRRIWRSESLKQWFMEPADPRRCAELIGSIPDAIQVTNARDILNEQAIEQLDRESEGSIEPPVAIGSDEWFQRVIAWRG